jgi:hypothetical protein
MAAGALKPIPKPAVCHPNGDFVVVFAQALLEVPHRIALSHTARISEAFQFVHDRTLRTMQPFRDRSRRHTTHQLLQDLEFSRCPRLPIHLHCQAKSRRLPLYVPSRQARHADHPVEHLKATIEPAEVLRF